MPQVSDFFDDLMEGFAEIWRSLCLVMEIQGHVPNATFTPQEIAGLPLLRDYEAHHHPLIRPFFKALFPGGGGFWGGTLGFPWFGVFVVQCDVWLILVSFFKSLVHRPLYQNNSPFKFGSFFPCNSLKVTCSRWPKFCLGLRCFQKQFFRDVFGFEVLQIACTTRKTIFI